MSPADLRQVRQLFDLAMELPPEERDGWLARATDWDAAIRAEVRHLLGEVDTASPLDVPRAGAWPRQDGVRPGSRLGPYDVIRLVGMGGMGAVYEAVRADDSYRKRVAIKLVQTGLDSDLTVARFRRERQILASLQHPNIATLLDGGLTAEGRPFLVMEFVEGRPITEWCETHALPLRGRLELFRQVCAAVSHAHKNLVVHRDLKPGNILVTADGRVKLLDFGIAKLLAEEPDDEAPLTRGGARPFTPEYASPEQIRSQALTTASDVYSLGVVLFELLTGRRPHQVDSRALADLERAVLQDPVPRPSLVARDARAGRRLRGELDHIVLHALRLEPERRYSSVDALDDDLRRYLDGLPVRAQRDWAGYRLRKFVLRHRGATAASLLLLLVLAAGGVALAVQASRVRAERSKAAEVGAFLQDLLRSVRPSTGGRDVPVSELLDAAGRRVDSELVNEPAVRAELESVIGESYVALGRFETAEPHLQRALALRRSVAGPWGDGVGADLSNLGNLYMAEGELDRADSLFREGLQLAGGAAAHADTTTALFLDNLGSVAHNRGDLAEAERLHRQALEIRRRLFPPGDDMIAYSLNNVAVALGDENRWAAAESLQRQALGILEANHPQPHPLVADALNSLATELDFQGKTAAAESAYVQTIDLRRRLLGPEHPDYASTVFNYAMFLFDQARYPEAMTLSQEVLALRGRTLPDSHPAVAAALQTIGRCRDHLGDASGADSALRESLALRRRYLPQTSWLIASSIGVLGEHYAANHDYPRAERLMLQADSLFTKEIGASNVRTLANVRRLVALYQAWGRPAQAAVYQRRLPPS